MENQFYVYAYIDPLTDQYFYIGKGSGNRDTRHLCDSKNVKKQSAYLYFYRKINKIRREIDKEPIIKRLVENLSMENSYRLEEEFIIKYGRKGIEPNGILYNRSLGGRGNRGAKYSKEACAKISKAHKGKKYSEERLKTHSQWCKKEFRSKQAAINLSKAQTGERNSAALFCILRKPDGKIIETKLIMNFCKENNLSYRALLKSFKDNSPFIPKEIYKNTSIEIKNTINWQLLEKQKIKKS